MERQTRLGPQAFFTHIYEAVSKSYWTESITKYTLTTNNKLSLRSNTKAYGGKTH